MASAEHLLAVAGPRQARPGTGPVPVRAGRGADRGRGDARGVLLRAAGRLDGRVNIEDVPDSEPNDAFFGRPSNQARDGAFAQVRWLAAAESGTGSLLGASLGPYRDSEQALARDLLEERLLRGRGCWCWRTASSCPGRWPGSSWPPGRTSCGAPRASPTLKPVKVLADGTYLAELTPPRKKDGPPLTVRVIEYTVHTIPEDGKEGVLGGVLPGHRPAGPQGIPGAGPSLRLPLALGLRDRHRPPQDGHG